LSEQNAPTTPARASGVPAPPPDDENPAIIFAKKTYFWILMFAAGFIGAVVLFIL